MSTTAVITHLLFWNWTDIKAAFELFGLANLRKLFTLQYWTFWKDSAVPEEN